MAEVVKSTPWTWRSLMAFAISLGAMNPIGILAVGLSVAMPFMAMVGIIEAVRERSDAAAQSCVETCHGHVARFSSEIMGRIICECR